MNLSVSKASLMQLVRLKYELLNWNVRFSSLARSNRSLVRLISMTELSLQPLIIYSICCFKNLTLLSF